MTKNEILEIKEHRPFPMPKSPWVMQQSWKDLLFLHYKVPYHILRPLVPQELELDTYNDEVWISITPFKMRNVKFRMLPSIPTATNFLELNLRTYVKFKGRGGIYFFSLDASSILSVIGARTGAFLPYFTASMSVNEEMGEFHFKSRRNKDNGIMLDVKYKPTSPPFKSPVGSLEEWLVERYCLFQETIKGKFLEIDIHHLKWSLQHAEAHILTNTLTKPLNLAIPDKPSMIHFSKYLKVLVWPPKIVSFR